MSSRFLNISTDNTLGGGSASDEIVSSQKAIKEYVDSHGGSVTTDGVTINTNADDEIQAIGVIEKNAGNVKYDWVGTSAEYTAQDVATLHPTWVCYITDDTDITLPLLEVLYPVGSIYIGTMATCPLESLGVGTWQLKTDNTIITSISSVAIKGDGKALGVTTNGSNVLNLTEAHADFKMTSSYNGGTLPQTGGGAWTTTNGLIGLTPDATKSGIVGEAVTTSLTVNIWERIA